VYKICVEAPTRGRRPNQTHRGTLLLIEVNRSSTTDNLLQCRACGCNALGLCVVGVRVCLRAPIYPLVVSLVLVVPLVVSLVLVVPLVVSLVLVVPLVVVVVACLLAL